MPTQISFSARGLALSICLLSTCMAHAQPAGQAPRGRPDTVSNGLVQLRPVQHLGLPLFDLRPLDYNAPDELRAPRLEMNRWLALAALAGQPTLLNDPRVAEFYARNFLPVDALDRYFSCGERACSNLMAGMPLIQRLQALASRGGFKGNEFEAKRAHDDFVATYSARLIAMAPALPQDAYVASAFQVGTYAAASGRLPIQYNFGLRQIPLGSGFCKETRAAMPTTLAMSSDQAETMIRKMEAKLPPRRAGDNSARAGTLLMKVRIDKAATPDFGRGSSNCLSDATRLEIKLLAGNSLDDVLGAIPVPDEPPPPQQQVRREPDARGFQLAGVRLGMSMADAEAAVRKHMAVDLVYKLETKTNATGYPDGLALVSVGSRELIHLYTGPATPGILTGIDRVIDGKDIDYQSLNQQYKQNYEQRSFKSECKAQQPGPAAQYHTATLVSGNASDPAVTKLLYDLKPAYRRVNSVYGLGKATTPFDYSVCKPHMDLRKEGNNVIFLLYDHSKSSFTAVPEAPKRVIKF